MRKQSIEINPDKQLVNQFDITRDEKICKRSSRHLPWSEEIKMREAIQYDVIIDFLLIGLIDLFIFHRLSLTEFFYLTPTVPEFFIILSVFIVCINIIITIKIFSSLAFNSFLIKSNIDELFSNYFILAPPSF